MSGQPYFRLAIRVELVTGPCVWYLLFDGLNVVLQLNWSKTHLFDLVVPFDMSISLFNGKFWLNVLHFLYNNSLWLEQYDWSKTVVAYGDTSEVFTPENITSTFGGMSPDFLFGPES